MSAVFEIDFGDGNRFSVFFSSSSLYIGIRSSETLLQSTLSDCSNEHIEVKETSNIFSQSSSDRISEYCCAFFVCMAALACGDKPIYLLIDDADPAP